MKVLDLFFILILMNSCYSSFMKLNHNQILTKLTTKSQQLNQNITSFNQVESSSAILILSNLFDLNNETLSDQDSLFELLDSQNFIEAYGFKYFLNYFFI